MFAGQSEVVEARNACCALATTVAPDDSSRKGVTGAELRSDDGNLAHGGKIKKAQLMRWSKVPVTPL